SSAIDRRASSRSGSHARGLPASSSPSDQTARSAARRAGSASCSAVNGAPSSALASACRRTIEASASKALRLLGSSARTARRASSWRSSPRRGAEVGRRTPTRDGETGRFINFRNRDAKDMSSTLAPRCRPRPGTSTLSTPHNTGPYARRVATRTRTSAPTSRRVRDSGGMLAAAALRRLEDELAWYRELPAEDRSWIGLVAQAGINAFISWYADPRSATHSVSEIFAAAPPELTRSISLQQTVQLVRIVVDVVDAHTDQLAAPGDEQDLREAVLVYSREVAFSAAEVYARAAEVRGARDARLEALVVDSLVRGEVADSVRSRAAALGWTGRGTCLAVCVTAGEAMDDLRAVELRRAARRAAEDCLVGIQGERVVVILGCEGDLGAVAATLA